MNLFFVLSRNLQNIEIHQSSSQQFYFQTLVILFSQSLTHRTHFFAEKDLLLVLTLQDLSFKYTLYCKQNLEKHSRKNVLYLQTFRGSMEVEKFLGTFESNF